MVAYINLKWELFDTTDVVKDFLSYHARIALLNVLYSEVCSLGHSCCF